MINIAALQGPYLVSDEMVNIYLPIIANILLGNVKADDGITSENKKRNQHYAISMGMNDALISHSKINEAPQGSIMVMPISGPIMKEDNCGTPGTDTMRGRIALMNASDNISGMILRINSGGGAVTGTAELANDIKNSRKPIVAYIDGNAASAALWIASAAKVRIASSKNSMVGSVGVASTMMDYSKRLEALGIKEHYVVSDGSEDKNASYLKVLKGNYAAYKAEVLNPLRDNFVAALRENIDALQKHETTAEPFTGKVYMAEKALSFGMVDEIGTFETAIQKLSDLTH
jgi:protease-4